MGAKHDELIIGQSLLRTRRPRHKLNNSKVPDSERFSATCMGEAHDHAITKVENEKRTGQFSLVGDWISVRKVGNPRDMWRVDNVR
jgi:hypothetical protein